MSWAPNQVEIARIRRMNMIIGVFLVAAYAACIPAANWLIQHIGTTCINNGPCLVPVAPGIMAPSGVMLIGLALLLRDLVQRRCGISISLCCIAAGAFISALVASASLVIASVIAFSVSELVDFSVYTPLAKRRFVLALFASCALGSIVDSALFLWFAFGSIDHLEGQVIGKMYATALFIISRIGRKAFS